MYPGSTKFRRNQLPGKPTEPVMDKKTGVESLDVVLPSESIPGFEITVRAFIPPPQHTRDPSIVLYYHGGGWCTQSPLFATYQVIGRMMASCGYLVLMPNYRLAPEHPFPVGIHDAYDSLKWAFTVSADQLPTKLQSYMGSPPQRQFILGGESAGGNIACVLAGLLRDGLGPDLNPQALSFNALDKLFLLYPALFMDRFVKDPPYQFYVPLLAAPVRQWYFHSYLDVSTNAQVLELARSDRRICPLLAGFHDFPPTLVVSGGEDFFSKENLLVVDLLKQNKVPVESYHRENHPHAYHMLSMVDRKASQAFQEILAKLAVLPGTQRHFIAEY